jgi:hypothetical protein
LTCTRLYYETSTTLPVDFHSFRRAFNTALAEARVNVQQAMSLASHWDARTHMRYVMRTRAMRTIPEAAIPRLPATLPGVGNAPVDDPGDVTARDVSTRVGPSPRGISNNSSGRNRI